MRKTIYIFDIDLTICDPRHRTLDKEGNFVEREWTDEEIMKDKRVKGMAGRRDSSEIDDYDYYLGSIPQTSILSSLFYNRSRDVFVFFSTARNEKYRLSTLNWLYNNIDGISAEYIEHNLLMRSAEDKKLSNAEIKRKNLYKIKAMYPDADYLVFDDCEDCIKMYKEEGCNTALVSIV